MQFYQCLGDEMIRKQLIFPLIQEICNEENISFIQEPTRGMYGLLLFENGNHFFIKDVNFNINYVSSMRVTKNKALTSFFLQRFGFSVPDFTMIYSDEICKKFKSKDTVEKGIKFSHKVGYPVILKPNDSLQGRNIYKVYNDLDFVKTVDILFQSTDTIQVQPYYNYKDYRIVTLGREIISAYERIPLRVTGDGVSSVRQLLVQKQNEFIDNGRDTVIEIESKSTFDCLNRLKINLDTIIEKGSTITLRDVSNLSAGGECADVMETIHDDYKKLCISVASNLKLNLSGIDIMCPDISEKVSDYVILEVNSAPGLDNYLYKGEKQLLYTKELYRKVILYLKNL